MPWQRHVLDVAYQYDPDTGELDYDEVDLTVPRQSGKTTMLLGAMVHRATRFGGPQNVTYTAQDRNHARKKWNDEHTPILTAKGSPYRRHLTVRLSNGSEAWLWANNSRHTIDAPTATAGHGDTLDLGVIDEAWARTTDDVEQAMRPAMITRGSAQLWVVSTAGNAKSFYLYRKVVNGRKALESGEPSRVCYFEWSATDDDDPEDPVVWRRVMPALGYTITERKIAAELAAAKRSGKFDLFLRAYLNRWVEVPPLDLMETQPITVDDWDACLDVESSAERGVVFAVDVTPDRMTASIVAAAPAQSPTAGLGAVHIEVIDNRPGEGTDWVIPALTHLMRTQGGRYVGVHLAGPAGSLELPLRRLCGPKLATVSDVDMVKACGAFQIAVRGGHIHHPDQPSIRAGLEGATRQIVGDAWKWSRKAATVDLSPVVAATVAHHVLLAHPPPAPPRRVR